MPNFNRWKLVVQKTILHQLLDITAPFSCALTTFSAMQSMLPFVLFHLSSPLHILTAEMVVVAQRAPRILNLCPGAPRHWPLEHCPQIINWTGWHTRIALANQQQVGVFPHSLERKHYLFNRGHHLKTLLCSFGLPHSRKEELGNWTSAVGSSGAWRPFWFW